MFREACYCAAKSPSVVDISFMPKKLHDLGEARMSAAIQERIDALDASLYDAILLGYGLCNYGVRGLCAPVPLVIPRAHDCIALLMGSRERYDDYFGSNPGTFYHSSGWIERDWDSGDEGIAGQLGIDKSREEYAALYGEENAEYLTSILGDALKNYRKVAYINTGICDNASDAAFSKRYADERGWEFEELDGDVGIFMRLLGGEWDERDFLVTPPSLSIEPSYDSMIVCAACVRAEMGDEK
jgi:hypothetical protein